jgi:hypothetical protein
MEPNEAKLRIGDDFEEFRNRRYVNVRLAS